MLHEDILYISYCKYIQTYFLLVICIAKRFIFNTTFMFICAITSSKEEEIIGSSVTPH